MMSETRSQSMKTFHGINPKYHRSPVRSKDLASNKNCGKVKGPLQAHGLTSVDDRLYGTSTTKTQPKLNLKCFFDLAITFGLAMVLGGVGGWIVNVSVHNRGGFGVNVSDITVTTTESGSELDPATEENSTLGTATNGCDKEYNCSCKDRGYPCEIEFVDCDAIKKLTGANESGIFTIHPVKQSPMRVYCDMETDEHGWVVFQRRMDGSVDFYRNWTEYKKGFGNLDGEFWLGNELVHRMTKDLSNQLRIDLTDFDGDKFYVIYDGFVIGAEEDKYKLHIRGRSGNTAERMSTLNNNQCFSTMDQDNDNSDTFSCAELKKGAWWFGECSVTVTDHLNGKYIRPGSLRHKGSCQGIIWWQLGCDKSLKFSEMKLRSIRKSLRIITCVSLVVI